VRVRPVLLTTALLLAALPAAAQQKPAPAATGEGAIRALVVQYDSAWRRKDAAAMGALLAPTYLFFTSTGEVGDRSQTLADLRSIGFVMGRIRRSEIMVRFTGGTVAVVSSRWETEGTADGAAFKQNQRCGLVWNRTGSTWQLISEHCIDIPVRRTWRERWDSLAADSARAANPDADSSEQPR
jgi:ketosteroid isomerase-like protein